VDENERRLPRCRGHRCSMPSCEGGQSCIGRGNASGPLSLPHRGRSSSASRAKLTLAADARRARRPGVCGRPQPRAKAGANRAGVDRLLIVLRRRADPSPTGTPTRGRARCGRTTAADAGRHAIGLLNIGAHGRRHGRPQPAAGAPSSPARRPDRLAKYMGCRANRRKDRVSRGTAPAPPNEFCVDRQRKGAAVAERGSPAAPVSAGAGVAISRAPVLRFEPEVASRVADHGLGVDDPVEVAGGDTERECCFTEGAVVVVGFVRDRGGLVVLGEAAATA
jgi:hypothetical protein